MKHLYSYIVCLFFIFNNVAYATEKVVMPADFTGVNTLKQVELLNKGENKQLTGEQIFQILYEIGSYFYNKYTIDDIFSENFIDEIRPFFPGDSESELESKLTTLRAGVNVYNKAKEIYNDYIKKRLVPDLRRKVRKSDEYDHPDEVKYIEPDEGYFVKVYNFKKFLTYSENEDERRAIIDFEQSDRGVNSAFDKIHDIIKTANWKKMLFYGTVYKNPLASTQGVTEEQSAFDVSARLIAQNTYINGNKELYFGIKYKTAPFTFILANNISNDITKPQIDLKDSENVEKSEVLYPIPLNAGNYPHIYKYFGEFLLPIKITVADVNKPLIIRAKTKVFSCDNALNCRPIEFNFELPLLTDGEQILANGYENYFNMNMMHMPNAEDKHLKMKKIVVDYDKNNNQVLRLEFESDRKVKNFKIFAEAEDEIILFAAPLISLQENKVYVRLIPYDGQERLDMVDKVFTISTVLNNRYYYRSVVKAGLVSDFDADAVRLNYGLLLLAILGGLILNFMPCVFPVISLKMMAFAKIKVKQRVQLKKDLWQTVAGIFSGFSLLIIMLWVAKYLGYSLGWGMQFQNMGFLVTMTFVVMAIIIALPVLNFESMTMPNLGKYSGFVIGNLAVLLATPCTGPYLASALGFALSGNYTDILIIMYGVAFGLSIPYLMILFLKQPETFFPKPGAWMKKLEIFMRTMLYLTLGWFLLLIFQQTDIVFVFKFVLIIAFFSAVMYFCKKFLEYTQGIFNEKITTEMLIKIRRWCYVFMLTVFVLCSIICTKMARTSFQINYEKNMQNRLTFLDKKLIDEYLNEGHPVLVEISADWCLTCHVNKMFVFNKTNMEHWKKSYNLEFLRVDWTNYNKDILEYMERFGRKGLPFYILYTPFIREGMVLPEIFEESDLSQILQNSNIR